MFEAKGLGQQVQSWVSTGPNLPISETGLGRGLGSDTVENVATQAGVPRPAVSRLSTMLLPVLVDRLTHEGRVPQDGSVTDTLRRFQQEFS